MTEYNCYCHLRLHWGDSLFVLVTIVTKTTSDGEFKMLVLSTELWKIVPTGTSVPLQLIKIGIPFTLERSLF